jgi:ribosomal protein S18 acetylase RimI-like enzyme
MAQRNPAPQIGIVDPPFRTHALELAFRDMPPDDRRRHIAEIEADVPPPGIAPLDGLWGAMRNGRLVGAMFSQVTSGKIAMVRLPQLVEGESQATASRLFSATWNFLVQQQVVLAQALLSSTGAEEAALLRLGRLHYLADLLYLVSPKNTFSNTIPIEQLEFKPYCTTSHAQWIEVITATHVESLDCSELKDPRPPDDMLAGYRDAGAFDPNLWLIARYKQQPVGCLLLADHPRHDTMELLYLGLIPEVRGRGWGKQLVRHAQWLTRRAGRRQLVTAVDSANLPAVQTYTAMDFQAWQRRRLYIKRFSRVAIGTHGLNSFSTMGVEASKKIQYG